MILFHVEEFPQMFDDVWLNIHNDKALSHWLRALCSWIIDFAFRSRIIRMPTNLLGESKKYRSESSFLWGHSLSPQKKPSISYQWFGGQREKTYNCITIYILGWGRAENQLSHINIFNKSYFYPHFSPCTLISLVFMLLWDSKRQVDAFVHILLFAILHELPHYLLFLFQNYWNLSVPEAHSLLPHLLSSIV